MKVDYHRLHDEAYRKLIFTTLMRDHQVRIYHYCVKRLGETVGEEIAQDVCLTAWENLETFRQESTIRTWLFGIAKYKCAEAFRKQRRRLILSAQYVNEIRYRNSAEGTVSPEEKAMDEAQWQKLVQGLSKMRQGEQWILNLRYHQGLSITEVAELLGKSEAAVYKRLSRALGRLRKMTKVAMAGYDV
jgi:RNA polymerase sigma-70 factor (ECF subfamily)